MPERVCLFGGTFDPIHNAHLDIARAAADKFGLDRVLFVPAANPPHKNPAGVTSYADRLRMVELACTEYPRFVASTLERDTERSYSIDTVEKLRLTLPPGDQLTFLIGSDAFDEITTWKRWKDLIATTEFIVAARPGRQYQIPAGAMIQRLDDIALPISSSNLRQRLASGDPTPEIPSRVRRFIDEHGLYRSTP